MRRGLGLVLLGVLGCATAPGGVRSHSTTITYAEVQGLNVPSAYEVVEMLRPQFLRTRGSASFADPTPIPAVVYLDGLKHGDTPESLKGIERTAIREIEYLDSREATTRYGTGHRGGAILVRTR